MEYRIIFDNPLASGCIQSIGVCLGMFSKCLSNCACGQCKTSFLLFCSIYTAKIAKYVFKNIKSNRSKLVFLQKTMARIGHSTVGHDVVKTIDFFVIGYCFLSFPRDVFNLLFSKDPKCLYHIQKQSQKCFSKFFISKQCFY